MTLSVHTEIARLRAMTVPELVVQYEELFGSAPRVKHREFLWKRIAWKLQERRFGGLSVTAKQRLDELIGELDLPVAEDRRTVSGGLRPAAARASDEFSIGSTIVREYRGHELRLTVVEGGFALDGVVHRSLSAAAMAATGSKWNGRLFWLGRNGASK